MCLSGDLVTGLINRNQIVLRFPFKFGWLFGFRWFFFFFFPLSTKQLFATENKGKIIEWLFLFKVGNILAAWTFHKLRPAAF